MSKATMFSIIGKFLNPQGSIQDFIEKIVR